jgi:hypothetical protein
LSAVSFTLKEFSGRVLHDGVELPHRGAITLTELKQLMGDPYWTDEDDEEFLLFYETDRGELQLEFSGKERLTALVMTDEPVMAHESERRAYKVTAPWPPVVPPARSNAG